MAMGYWNRSRKNTRIQKNDCVKRTFEPKVTTIWNSASYRAKVASNLWNFKRPLLAPRLSVSGDFFLNTHIFSIPTQPKRREAVWAIRFLRKRLLLILIRVEIWWKNKKEIQRKRMSFTNRSRKNTRNQKKNCVKRTFEPKVTIIRKFSILKIEGSREKGKLKRP